MVFNPSGGAPILIAAILSSSDLLSSPIAKYATALLPKASEFSGKNFVEFKENLSQVLVDKIIPISNEIKKLLDDKNYLDQVLSEGCNLANDIASEKVKKIHKIVGF